MTPRAESLIVAFAALGILLLLTEQIWKPPLIDWLTQAPVLVVDCRRVL